MKLLYCVILVALLVNVASATEDENPEEEARLDAECEWTRNDVFECVERHGDDVNEDGKFDAREMSLFKKKLLGNIGNAIADYALPVANFFGGLVGKENWLAKYTISEIMAR